jgi:hypothetical protein
MSTFCAASEILAPKGAFAHDDLSTCAWCNIKTKGCIEPMEEIWIHYEKSSVFQYYVAGLTLPGFDRLFGEHGSGATESER